MRYHLDLAHAGIAAAAMLACSLAAAQEIGESSPRGQITITYQNQKTQDLVLSHETLNSPVIRTHLVDFDARYRVKERWTIHVGLPVISREATPTESHNPRHFVPPVRDSDFVDDGHYHTYLQDLRLGASYRLRDEPVRVEPYFEYGIPASDYPFFAASTIGRHVQTLEVGSTVAYRPPFLQWYFSLRAGYQMADKVLGYDIDAVRITADAAYFINPRMTLNVFLTSKNGKGFDPLPAPDFTSPFWYHHDQMTRHNFRNLGTGVDWSLDERNVLNFTLLKMVHAEDVFRLQRGLSVSLTRAF